MEPIRATDVVWPPYRHYATRVASVALAGLLLAILTPYGLLRPSLAPVIWLPSGLALAAILVGGWSYWPAALGGAVGALLLPGMSIQSAMPLALALFLEPLIAAGLLHLLGCRDWRTAGLRGYLLLILAAAVIAAAITAYAASISFAEHNAWTEWWMGSSLGLAFVTPCILGLLCHRGSPSPTSQLHALLYAVVFAVIHYLVFFVRLGGDEEPLPVGFLVFPLMIWCALRFGVTATSIALLGSLLLAHAGDIRGTGFFGQIADEAQALYFWLYYAMLGLSSMTLAVLIDGDRTIRRELVDSRQQLLDRESLLRAIYDASSVAIFLVDRQGHLNHVNQHMAEMFRWPAAELSGTEYVSLVHPDERNEARQRTLRLLASPEDQRIDLERLYQRRDGSSFWGHLSGGHLRDAAGNMIGLIGVIADISDRKEAESKIRHMAQYDHLTDLPNRALLHDRITQTLAAARRYDRRFALLFVDLDNFKPVNDIHGHEMGDLLLREVATRLLANVRAADTVARHGGDEFVVLATEIVDEAEVRALAEKLLAVVGAPYRIRGTELAITLSIGIAIYPRDGEDIDSLLRRADAAMYQAKHDGRNRVVMPG